jgi:hypothetical protein
MPKRSRSTVTISSLTLRVGQKKANNAFQEFISLQHTHPVVQPNLTQLKNETKVVSRCLELVNNFISWLSIDVSVSGKQKFAQTMHFL